MKSSASGVAVTVQGTEVRERTGSQAQGEIFSLDLSFIDTAEAAATTVWVAVRVRVGGSGGSR